MLQKAIRNNSLDINCVDSFGRGGLTLAIDGENLEMVELLIIMGLETKDALLEAITQEFVEAVELLLEHEELIHKDGDPYVRLTVKCLKFRAKLICNSISSRGRKSTSIPRNMRPKSRH